VSASRSALRAPELSACSSIVAASALLLPIVTRLREMADPAA
jgi:hypothetical protein